MYSKIAILMLPMMLCSCSSGAASGSSVDGNSRYVYQNPKSETILSLSSDAANRLGRKALESIENALHQNEKNAVISPASYILALSGLASVSKDFPSEACGLKDNAIEDVKDLLTAWNFEYSYKPKQQGYDSEDYCSFEAVIAHQTVGGKYRFDPEKRKAFASDYVSTIESTLGSYHKDAESFFHDELHYSIPVPDPNLDQDGVITYGGFKMKDFVAGGMGEAQKMFLDHQVKACAFGSKLWPLSLRYLELDDCEVFRFPINHTSLTFVLPKKDVKLDDVSLSSSYKSFLERGASVDTMGYVPYFHIANNNVNLTSSLKAKLTGKEVFYDKLLQDSCPRDLRLSSILQNNDFEFNQFGVSGESITAISMAGSSAPMEHEVIELNVDRPFYAIAEKDGFPLFANKVVEID